ncbi:hypothetical protein C0J52_00593 [Blattella germanica]|nr:hypothetical protein C0J52_00593 [Blattella germanica]
MGDDIKPETIKKTQETLGKYIKRPPFTEKLLKKPPFRFLHDIIAAVIRETGFLQGLYTAEELNHENIKDRDAKVAFLQKVIDATKTITGTNLTVRPSKIVAGHEPTKTNELLQAIGKALDKKLSSEEYVESLKKGKKPTKPSSKESKTSLAAKQTVQARGRSQDRGKSKDSEKKKPATRSGGDTSGRPAKAKGEKSNKPAPASVEAPKPETAHPPPPPEEEEPVPLKTEEKRPQSARPGHRKASAKPREREPETHVANLEAEAAGGDGGIGNVEPMPAAEEEPRVLGSPVPANVELEPQVPAPEAETQKVPSPGLKPEPATKPEPSVIPKSARPRPQTAYRPPSARPPSARPAAPRIRDRGEVRATEEISPSPIAGKVNVITENDAITEQEEDDTFVVVESQSAILIEEPPPPAPAVEAKPPPEGQHGHLVAKILETQKELEDDSRLSNQDGQTKKVEIEWETDRHREREMASREVDRLRNSIQTLTRAANPLGKLMDFLQEDVDSMQRELETWHRTNAALVAELRTEQEQTRSLTEPLERHLEQLDTSIMEQLNQVSAMKATVLRNDQRIQRLLTGQDSK